LVLVLVHHRGSVLEARGSRLEAQSKGTRYQGTLVQSKILRIHNCITQDRMLNLF